MITSQSRGAAAACVLPLCSCVCALGVAKVWVTSALARSCVAQVLVVGALTVLRVELQDGGHRWNDIKSSLSAECNWPQHAENGLWNVRGGSNNWFFPRMQNPGQGCLESNLQEQFSSGWLAYLLKVPRGRGRDKTHLRPRSRRTAVTELLRGQRGATSTSLTHHLCMYAV